LRLLLSIICLILCKGILHGFWIGLSYLFGKNNILFPFLIGIIAALIIYYLLLKNASRLNIFEHELTHAFVAILFFRKISNFVVTRSGGSVLHSSGFGGEFGDLNITLAPYFLPTFTFIAILFRPILSSNFFPWFDIFIGFTLCYHFLSTADEIKVNWSKVPFVSSGSGEWSNSDIGKVGYIFAVIYIFTITFAIHGFILWILVIGYDGVIVYWGIIFRDSEAVVNIIINFVDSLV